MSSRPFFSEFFLTSHILRFRLKISILKVKYWLFLIKWWLIAQLSYPLLLGVISFHLIIFFIFSAHFSLLFLLFLIFPTPQTLKKYFYLIYFIYLLFTTCSFIVNLFHFFFFYWFSRWNDWKSIWNEVRFFLFREWQPYHAQQGIL